MSHQKQTDAIFAVAIRSSLQEAIAETCDKSEPEKSKEIVKRFTLQLGTGLSKERVASPIALVGYERSSHRAKGLGSDFKTSAFVALKPQYITDLYESGRRTAGMESSYGISYRSKNGFEIALREGIHLPLWNEKDRKPLPSSNPQPSSNGSSMTEIIQVGGSPDSPEKNHDQNGPLIIVIPYEEKVKVDNSQRPTEINFADPTFISELEIHYPVSKACEISAQLSAQTDFSEKNKSLADQVSLFAQLGISYTWIKKKK